MEEQPCCGAEQHHPRADLRDATDEHDRGEHHHIGHATNGQPDATQAGLHQRRYDDAHGHGANGLPGQDHRLVATLPPHAPGKPAQPLGGLFAAHVEQGGHADGQQQVQGEHAQAARARGDPAGQLAGVGLQLRDQGAGPGRYEGLPLMGEPRAQDGNAAQPARGGRQRVRQQRGGFVLEAQHVGGNRAHGHAHRHDHQGGQGGRHQRGRGPAPVAQPGLRAAHHGPCGDHDHRGPHDGGQEGFDDPDAAPDQQADQQHDEHRAGNVVARSQMGVRIAM